RNAFRSSIQQARGAQRDPSGQQSRPETAELRTHGRASRVWRPHEWGRGTRDWVIGLILALGCVAAGARAQEAPPNLARRIAHEESETQAARNDYTYR